MGGEKTYIWSTLFALGLSLVYSGAAFADDQQAFTQRINSYLSPQADESKCAVVEDLRLERERGSLVLEEGLLYLCREIDGKVPAVVFHGKGRFTLEPSSEVERQLIYNELETDTISEKFEYLFLAATDSLLEELQRSLTFQEKGVTKLVKRDLTVYETFLTKSRGGQFYVPYISCFENEVSGFFVALFGKDKLNPRVFMMNPLERESVSYRIRDVKDAEYGFKVITIYDPESETPVRLHQFSLDTCTITAEIYSNYSLDVSAEVRFSPNHLSWRTMPFYLLGDMKIDSVRTAAGVPLAYFRSPGRPAGFIELDRRLSPTDWDTVTVVYRGGEDFALQSHYRWYPKLLSGDKAPFDLTFTCPKKLSVISEGKRGFQAVGDKTRISRWVTDAPIRWATFAIGDFYEESRQFRDGPEIRFFARGALSDKPDEEAIERMAGDMTQATVYFTHLFGSCPFDTLMITQYGSWSTTPYSRGLIHLQSANFFLHKKIGELLLLRLSATANQWFGESVEANTYQDVWIIHGLTQYVSAMMLQVVRGDHKFFYEVMEEARKNAMHGYFDRVDHKKYFEPLTLGARSKAYGRYDRMTYIFHMLRMMLQEGDQDQPIRFYELLRSLYERCGGGFVTTKLFEEVTSETFGIDMGWFFDQWVHGSHLPEYKYAVKTEKNSEGKFVSSLRIRDERAPEGFRAIVPILLTFDGDRFAQLKILVNGNETFVELPATSEKPNKVVFNDMGGVLCNAVEVKW